MVGSSTVRYFAMAAGNFQSSSKMAKNNKNDSMYLKSSIMVFLRMPFIIDQFRIHTPNFNLRFTWAPLVLGILTQCVEAFAQRFLKCPNPISVKEKISQATYQVLTITEKTSKFIFQQTDKIFNTAYLINAAALIYFGFTLPGSIALLGLCTLAIKRYNFLPPTLERLITPIILVGDLVTTLVTPMNIVLKVINVSTSDALLPVIKKIQEKVNILASRLESDEE
jgi:hypothetical protein